MSEGTKRRLAAIVSADVVGYSRLMGEDETGTLAAMRAHRMELWNPVIEQYGGRVVGTAGDSLLIEYASAVAAVEGSVGHCQVNGFPVVRSSFYKNATAWLVLLFLRKLLFFEIQLDPLFAQ